MITVYVGQEKHDTPVYASPLAAVAARIESTYEFEDPEVLAEAVDIVESGDQGDAWRFLQKRADWEYEGISRVRVIDRETLPDLGDDE
jgi:hypothetical protein